MTQLRGRLRDRLRSPLLRDESGQALVPTALILSIVLVLLMCGVLGASQAYVAKSATQAAADAASLAAAAQAQPVYQIAVTWHQEVCYVTKHGLDCYDGGPQTNAVQGRISALFSPSGWMADAGCNAGPSDVYAPGVWHVCTAWQRTGVSWTYPDPTAAQQAAMDYLQANLAANAGQDHWQMTSFAAEQGSGRAVLTVQLRVHDDPMAVVMHHPVTLTVTSGSYPQAPAGLPTSGT